MALLRTFGLLLAGLLAGALSLYGQALPTLGQGATLEVGTWNIENFGDPSRPPWNDAAALQAVEYIMETLEVDLWALQEMADEEQFFRLLDALGPAYDGYIGDPDTYTNLRLAFVYRKATVEPLGAPYPVLEEVAYKFAGRPPFRMDARVHLPDTVLEASFLTVHLKSEYGCWNGDLYCYNRRKEAADTLKGYIEAELYDRPVFLLGDFNDRLVASITPGQPSPFEALVADSLPQPDPQYYFFPTLALDRRGENSYCFDASCLEGSLIDHIMTTDEGRPLYVSGSAHILREVLDVFPDFVDGVSDHLPVVARFAPERALSSPSEGLPSLPSVAPNPFTDALILQHLRGPGEVVLYDLLGRRLARHPFTGPVLHWRLSGTLAPGVYLLCIRMENQVVVKKVVRR